MGFPDTLRMLWSGKGLANLLPWLPAGARIALAVWLPVAFKVAIRLIVTGLVYRIVLLPAAQPRSAHARRPPHRPPLGD